MNEPIPGVVLRHNGRDYPVIDLSEFGFTVPQAMAGIAIAEANDAKLQLEPDDVLDIQFRVRGNGEATSTVARFWKLTLKTKGRISKFNEIRNRSAGANEVLVSRSYDELAAGLSSEEAVAKSENKAGGSKSLNQSTGVKSVAAIVLLFGMLAVALLAFAFLRSRNSLEVSNSALVGNFIPVNARVAGEITEVFFDDGERVKKGDVLMQLRNPDVEFNYRHFGAQRDAAKAKHKALQIELDGYQRKLGIAAKKLDLDMKVAKSKLAHAQKMVSMFGSAIKRLQPGIQSGSITQLEFDEVDAQLAAAVAAADAQTMEMESIELARSAISSEVLILGNRVNDEMGRIRSDLADAKAEYEQFKTLADLAEQQASQLEIRAPRDGSVHARYRQKGEFLKAADEAIAISYPGRVWASGHVTAQQASRIRPGQKVSVNIPSMHLELNGTVSAVGHRSVYSKGNYNAEFRGTTATDVPVKVQIVDVPNGVPSGIRMDMSITTGFGVAWIDEMMGIEVLETTPVTPRSDWKEIDR